MNVNKKNIWIDLDNSPHVPFFSPISKELEQRGFKVVFTARDCFQVCGLADLFKMSYKRVGRHYGKHKFLKIYGTVVRAIQLIPTVLKSKPIIAVSHGSRSQLIASRMANIPSIYIFDYEYAKKLPLLNPTLGIVPDTLTKNNSINGIRPIFTYPGLKEDVYAIEFTPDLTLRATLGIEEDEILATIRPPATEAHYHNPEAEKLFIEVVNLLGKQEKCRMVILPRNEISQKNFIQNKWQQWCQSKKIIIPQQVLKGLDLIWASDLVISGGGTMNREAAALGVPVYSIFRGTIGAIDRELSNTGRLTLIEKVEDVEEKIKLEYRQRPDQFKAENKEALTKIVDIIESQARRFMR